jgi:4-oxalocrotonate tautomerase
VFPECVGRHLILGPSRGDASAAAEGAEDVPMPYLNLKITDDGVTRAQKARLVAEFTDTLVRVLGKRPEHTHIVIDEVKTDNWGFAGVLTTEYRANAAKRPAKVRPARARAAARTRKA